MDQGSHPVGEEGGVVLGPQRVAELPSRRLDERPQNLARRGLTRDRSRTSAITPTTRASSGTNWAPRLPGGRQRPSHGISLGKTREASASSMTTTGCPSARSSGSMKRPSRTVRPRASAYPGVTARWSKWYPSRSDSATSEGAATPDQFAQPPEAGASFRPRPRPREGHRAPPRPTGPAHHARRRSRRAPAAVPS